MAEGEIIPHQVVGNGNSIGLLLLHPLGAGQDFWQACIDVWRSQISCVAVDLRSSIATDAGELPVTLEQHVEDLHRLRSHLGFERVIPIGCAISTMIAAALASTHPETVAALVLSNATPRSSPQARSMLSERGALVRREGIAAILPQAVDRAFLNQPRDRRYQQYFEAFATQSAEDYALACEASACYDAEAHLRAVRCPALVIAGEHDVLLPPALAHEVAGMVPGAEMQVMPGVAHFAPYQAPVHFAETVLDFLKRKHLAR